MKPFIAALFSLVLLSGCDVSLNKPTPKVIASDAGTEQQQRQVYEAAVEFLQLLDNGKTSETWSTVSPALKATTHEMVWTGSLKALRLGLGSFKERTPAGIGFTDQMPEAPAGNYAVIEFNSTFAASSVTEKVLFRDDDKHWLVVGYFVNKSVIVDKTGQQDGQTAR